MALKDLVVSEEEVSEQLVEEILRGSARLANDTKKVLLTTAGARLPAKAKVLLLLAAQHAWRFISPGVDSDLSLTVKGIQEQTGLPGNTLRPTLKSLKDEHIVVTSGPGSYQLPAHSLHQALEEINKARQKM